MAYGKTNASTAGSNFTKSVIIVSVPAGSTVTATLGPQIKTAQEKNGEAWLRNLDVGEWNLKLTLGEQSATAKYNIPEFGVYRTSMAFQLYPDDFDWSGMGEKGVNYEIVRDDDTPIPVEDYRKYKNWKARLLTSGYIITLVTGRIDVFLVAGGAGGGGGGYGGDGGPGGGGYHKTITVNLTAGKKTEIVIGAGGLGGHWNSSQGEPATKGGDTSAFGETVSGGKPGEGFIDGAKAGEGGTEVGEFETEGATYSGHNESDIDGKANSGKGGGGGPRSGAGTFGANGGSGIVIIRNTREVA